MTPPQPLNDVMGRYQLVRRLAAGGMAEVFLARTRGAPEFSKTVVVKRILPNLATNQEFITLFLNEARISAQLQHPNVVQFFDLGEENGQYFLAMEYMDGPTVRGLLRGAYEAKRQVPMGVGLKLISLALEGLAYAHGFCDQRGRPQNLVHRDISPHNILLGRNGAVKVADFGIAKAASLPSITKTGQVRGKLRYMSPEQLTDGPLDGRSDLFAVGITLFELLTGARPFQGDGDAEVIAKILEHPPLRLDQFRDDVPKGLQEMVEKSLAKEREDRYPSAQEMQAELEATLVKLGQVVRGAEIAAFVDQVVPREADPVAVSDGDSLNIPVPPRKAPPGRSATAAASPQAVLPPRRRSVEAMRPAAPPEEPPATAVTHTTPGSRAAEPEDRPATVVDRREREPSAPPPTHVTRTDPDPIDAVPSTKVTDPSSKPARPEPATEHEADAHVEPAPSKSMLDALTPNQRLGLGIGLGAALVLLLAVIAAAMGVFTHSEVERVPLPAAAPARH